MKPVRAGLVAAALLVACRPPAAERPWLEEDAWARTTGAAGGAGGRGAASGDGHGDGADGDGAAGDAGDERGPGADGPAAPVGGGAAAAAAAAARALHTGELAQARRWLDAAAAAPDRAAVAEQLAALEAALAARPPPDPAVVAVLLPLSGPHAALGRELRQAIEAAPAGGARRLFLDTAGEPERAAAAVEAAVAQRALVALGPVGVREAQAAAVRAVALGLPIALLAPAEGADPEAGVFRLAGSPEAEARAAAAVAVALGVPTVGVLAPRDDVGQAAEEAFAAAAAAAGLAVTARGLYDPTASALQPDLQAFLGLDPATNPRLAAHLRRHGKRGLTTFSPDVPFALLYLPDRYDRAALVASYLPYLGVEVHSQDFLDPEYLRRKHGGRIPQVVQLLGSSGWHHPALTVRGGDAVEGAYFVEPCPGLDGGGAGVEPLHAAFAGRGAAPSTAAQEAHDAWLLVERARASAAGAPSPRAAWSAALAGARLDDGACAPAAIVDGALVREPALLGVDAGEIVPVPY